MSAGFERTIAIAKAACAAEGTMGAANGDAPRAMVRLQWEAGRKQLAQDDQQKERRWGEAKMGEGQRKEPSGAAS
tara:strand:+ start:1606 stop:1830 length:225 start_codon:yes stop_codon:yes gene_type:complete